MFKKNFFILLIIWIISLLGVSIWTFENPDKIELIKNIYKKNKSPIVELEVTAENQIISNSFIVTFKKIMSLSHKTAFISYKDRNKIFNVNSLNIYTQNGFLISPILN